jgi:hypothetical protein
MKISFKEHTHMARKAGATSATVAQPAATPAQSTGDLLAQLATMMAAATTAGIDPSQAQAIAQQEQLRKQALNDTGFGIMTVAINNAIKPLKDNSGNITVLARFISEEKGLAQDENPLAGYLEEVLKVNPDLEVQLYVGESFTDKLSDKREQLGGALAVEFTINNLCEFRQVQAKWSKDELNFDLAGKKQYIIDPTADWNSPANWSAEDTGYPRMKLRLRVQLGTALSWTKAPMVLQRMPLMDKLLTLASVSQSVKDRNLGLWAERKQAENEAAMAQASTLATDAISQLNQ